MKAVENKTGNAQEKSRVTIREAGPAELDLIMKWRMEVLHQVFHVPDADPMTELAAQNRAYYESHLTDGSTIVCFAEMDGDIIGCGGVCLYTEMPSPDNPSGKCAYLMNIYTRKPYRGYGTGRRMVSRLIETVRALGIRKIYLETSEDGRKLYHSMGFTPMKDYLMLHEASQADIGNGEIR